MHFCLSRQQRKWFHFETNAKWNGVDFQFEISLRPMLLHSCQTYLVCAEQEFVPFLFLNYFHRLLCEGRGGKFSSMENMQTLDEICEANSIQDAYLQIHFIQRVNYRQVTGCFWLPNETANKRNRNSSNNSTVFCFASSMAMLTTTRTRTTTTVVAVVEATTNTYRKYPMLRVLFCLLTNLRSFHFVRSSTLKSSIIKKSIEFRTSNGYYSWKECYFRSFDD